MLRSIVIDSSNCSGVIEPLLDNDSVHPARAMKVSISKAPVRGLGCNGWFVEFLRKFEDYTILSLVAAETMIIEYTANDVKKRFALVIACKLQIIKNCDHI